MPKDFKKMYLDEQNARLKQDLLISDLKKEMEDLKKNQLFQQQQFTQQPQSPYAPNQPQQQPTQFEADVRYIVGLCQRMSIILKDVRRLMLPMELGKRIDVVLREIDRL